MEFQLGMPLLISFASRNKSYLSTKTKFLSHLRGCISVKFVAALRFSTNCFKDIRHGASPKHDQHQLDMSNSTLRKKDLGLSWILK